jgi:hypothetical protein
MLRRGAKQARKTSAAVVSTRAFPTPWAEALPTFQTTFQECFRIRRGCRWCSQKQNTCCLDFERHLNGLRLWREEMRQLSSERRDTEVLLMFGAAAGATGGPSGLKRQRDSAFDGSDDGSGPSSIRFVCYGSQNLIFDSDSIWFLLAQASIRF